MKTSRVSVILSFFFFTSISNFCWGPSATSKSTLGVYEATTPCTESVASLLKLAAGFKCEMMKWNLSLYAEPGKTVPSTFDLVCTYGEAKQGTRGFVEGARKLELKGKCRITAGLSTDAKAMVYELVDDNSNTTLSFARLDQNLLHLLANDKTLMVGTAAWSYTLTRTEPVSASPGKFISKPVSQIKLTSPTSIVGIFEGRSPCDDAIKNIHGITSANCNLVKYQLTLFQDSLTHTPSTFKLYTIYVGFGDDNKYRATGTWKILQGTIADPAAIVYQLQPVDAKSQAPILLQKADDNLLFFLNNDTQLLVGNEYCSYTLNRKSK